MLCSWSSLNPSVNFISNIKSFQKLEKYLSLEKEIEETYLLKNFVKQLELSPAVVNILQENLKSKNGFLDFNFHSKIHRKNINLLIKRSFHYARSSERVKNSKLNSEVKNSEPLKKILEIYNLKPNIQSDIVEAYQLGYERFLNSGNRMKAFPSLKMIVYSLVACCCVYILYNSMNNFANNSFGRFFAKTWTDSGVTLINKTDVTFEDVQGCDEVKKELENVVYFLKNPAAFSKIGAQLPKGIVLSGSPGVGKTLLAKAVAGEAGVSFLYISGSQFDEMFVGVGASRIRSMFNAARENSPCVVFIDELDAVCGERTSSMYHPYANQTINQLLSEMDGFTENEGIIVIGATNRIESLDKAVLRPGRFDLKITVHPPDYLGRVALLNLYLSKVKTDSNVDIPNLAKSTIGQSGADIKNLVNQAAIICSLKNDPAVTMSHLWEAETKINLGSARNRPPLESDNRNTAFHEAGHSIVMYFTPNSPHKIKQVTILPRGNTGGHNSFLPKVESSFMSKSQILARIDCIMGGRAAEELLNGADNISTGVSHDMQVASELAKSIVKSYTMSEEVGLQVISTSKCQCGGQALSPTLSNAIDSEVNKILKESYARAKSVIEEHEKEWHALANNLLKYETLGADDIELIMKGKKPKVATVNEEIIGQNKKSILDISANQLFELFSGKNTKK